MRTQADLKTENIHLRASPRFRAQLEELCLDLDLPISDVVRFSVLEMLKARRTIIGRVPPAKMTTLPDHINAKEARSDLVAKDD